MSKDRTSPRQELPIPFFAFMPEQLADEKDIGRQGLVVDKVRPGMRTATK